MFNGDLLYNLHTLDCLVYEVQNISVDLAKLETLETVYIMEMLGALNKLGMKVKKISSEPPFFLI